MSRVKVHPGYTGPRYYGGNVCRDEAPAKQAAPTQVPDRPDTRTCPTWHGAQCNDALGIVFALLVSMFLPATPMSRMIRTNVNRGHSRTTRLVWAHRARRSSVRPLEGSVRLRGSEVGMGCRQSTRRWSTRCWPRAPATDGVLGTSVRRTGIARRCNCPRSRRQCQGGTAKEGWQEVKC